MLADEYYAVLLFAVQQGAVEERERCAKMLET